MDILKKALQEGLPRKEKTVEQRSQAPHITSQGKQPPLLPLPQRTQSIKRQRDGSPSPGHQVNIKGHSVHSSSTDLMPNQTTNKTTTADARKNNANFQKMFSDIQEAIKIIIPKPSEEIVQLNKMWMTIFESCVYHFEAKIGALEERSNVPHHPSPPQPRPIPRMLKLLKEAWSYQKSIFSSKTLS